MKRFFIFLILFSAFIPLASQALEISDCSILTEEGEYFLINNITNSAFQVCINISSDHITLDCQGHSIQGVNAAHTTGIKIFNSSDVEIKNCILRGWSLGIEIERGKGNFINNCTIEGNEKGIRLWLTTNNSIKNTDFNENKNAIYLGSSSNNIISNNLIQKSGEFGVYLINSGLNIFYNNILNNTKNFYIGGVIFQNYWNTSKEVGMRIFPGGIEVGGNYWASPDGKGFSEVCNDVDLDCFCDEVFVLNEDNIDYLPYSNKCVVSTTTTSVPPTLPTTSPPVLRPRITTTTQPSQETTTTTIPQGNVITGLVSAVANDVVYRTLTTLLFTTFVSLLILNILFRKKKKLGE